MTRTALRIVYAGTPEFACPPLRMLIDGPHQLLAVFTQPDRPAGRGRQLQASPVKQMAAAAGLRIEQPPRLSDDALYQAMRELQPDLMVVAAYGLLLPQSWLDLPQHGCWNIHASLLPRWRGAAPIQRAIEAGDSTTGITLMQMELGLDSGPMLLREETPITADDTGGSLHDRLALSGAAVLEAGLQRLTESGPWHGEVQDDSLVTYASKLSKAEARLDWTQSAATLARQVRAFNPYPVCWTEVDDERLRIWQAAAIQHRGNPEPGELLMRDDGGVAIACADGALQLLEVQPPGKRRQPVRDWLNARRSR
ncbi:MAG: methionyl-tRNA formyltransferase [Wenzhouxiangellaceae bacterium]